MTTPRTADVQNERRLRDRTARSNLAAIACQRFGVDPATGTGEVREAAEWFAEIAAILGLEAVAR